MADFKILLILLTISLVKTFSESLDDTLIQLNNKNFTEKILSRRRRYLVFPEGSSLQLVFCLTVPTSWISNTFTVGSTVALAWQLPHEPIAPFRKPAEVIHRIDDDSDTFASDKWASQDEKSPKSRVKYPSFSQGDQSSTWTYKTILYQPATSNEYRVNKIGYDTKPAYYNFNKYSLGKTRLKNINRDGSSFKSFKYPNQFFQKKVYKEPITTYVPPMYHEVYRRTRRDLFSKVQSLYSALSQDGRSCLMKSICEVSQATHTRGTFIEEILKVIFRIKPHDGYKDEDDYDKAANKKHNCTDTYPACTFSVMSLLK